MPRGMDPALNLKLGPGGLADVEWVAQLLQLRHAHAVPGAAHHRDPDRPGGGPRRRAGPAPRTWPR